MEVMQSMKNNLDQRLDQIPDSRNGPNKQYSVRDAMIAAFACFWAQDGSLLQFQKRMSDEFQESNFEKLFEVNKIPTDDTIRNICDQIDPVYLNQSFYDNFDFLLDKKVVNNFEVLDNNSIIIALDGTKTFKSNSICCENCNIYKHKNGQVENVHLTLGTSIVSPKTDIVIPLPPEHNLKEKNNKKQDCEQNAIYRWFEKNYDIITNYYPPDKIIILADDLHSRNNFVSSLNDKGLKFILNCKENSHKTLFEFTKYNDLNSISYYDKVKGFKTEKLHIISWLSGLPLRDNAESETVNFISLKIIDGKKRRKNKYIDSDGIKKTICTATENYDIVFSFITNIPLTINNVKEIIEAARARWKIENNNFNILKNSGYNIKHNFGHGNKFLASTLLSLNILAFSFHCVMQLCDEYWIKAYNDFNNRIKFFSKLNNLLSFYIFDSFDHVFKVLSSSRPPPDSINNIIYEQNQYLLNQNQLLNDRIDNLENLIDQMMLKN